VVPTPGHPNVRDEDGGPSNDAASTDPRIGQRFGKYQVTRLIGSGGMATVYEAEDTTLNRHVAIKFLPEARKEQHVAVERFINEAQVAGRLNHPNIIAIYDIGFEHEAYYIAMELLNPGSAGHYLKRRGRMNWFEAAHVVAQCCSALTAAHQAGLIHRDIKPDNILVSPAGTVKLADFGLVKELFEETGLTKSGVVVGTPLYMSPEQASAQPLDARTDIYSLGATFFALLSGSPPYTTGSVPQIMMAHVKAPVPDPRRTAPEVPESIVQIVRRSMAKRPSERFQNAEEMRHALEAAVAGSERPTFSFLIASRLSTQPQRLRAAQVKSRSDTGPKSPSPEPSPPPQAAPAEPLAPSGTSLRKVMTTSRRAVLAGGAGLVLSGAGVALLFRGGKKPTPPPTDKPPQQQGTLPVPASKLEPIKVGVINSLAGTLSISARPVVEATMLAIDEINERGGILGGRQIKAIISDGKSDNMLFARETERLITEEHVITLFGGWTGSNRRTMRPIIERYQNLLMFPARDEGLEDSLNIIYCGPVPNQVVLPALKYVLEKLRVERIYFVGTDGLFSHTAYEMVRDALKDTRAHLVGDEFALLGQKNFVAEIRKLKAAKPDFIFNTLVGGSNIDFMAELRAAGITAKEAPTLSFTMGENELAEIADIDLTGDYVAASYFQALKRPENQSFVQRFRQKYGDYRVTSGPMEAAYTSVYLWAQAVEAAGVVEVAAIRSAMRNQSYDGPGGTVRIDPSNLHTWRAYHLGRFEADGIQIVDGSESLIQPEPFPTSRTRAEWEAFLESLHKRWGGSWVNPEKPNPLSK
jgi:urea transport system substrate-binding protein